MTARVDTLFAAWNRPDSPGCGVGVGRNGAVIYERGYGTASLERHVPITASTVFPLASITKAFTAMSVLLAAEQGLLSLDDDVSKYIPDWSNREHRVTIRHVLTHTSGLRDAYLLQGWAPNIGNSSDAFNQELRKVQIVGQALRLGLDSSASLRLDGIMRLELCSSACLVVRLSSWLPASAGRPRLSSNRDDSPEVTSGPCQPRIVALLRSKSRELVPVEAPIDEARPGLTLSIARSFRIGRTLRRTSHRSSLPTTNRRERPSKVGMRDVRYAFRLIRRQPMFAALVIATLTLGIGASTSMFSVVNGVLLKPLPYSDPDRLVWMYGAFRGSDSAAVSPPDFVDYRNRNEVFERLGAMAISPASVTVSGSGAPIRLRASQVSAELFSTLGAVPALGRDFSRSDETKGPVAIIVSHRLWQERFDGATDVVGRSIVVDGRPFTVAGVMPAGFTLPYDSFIRLTEPVDLYLPLALDDADAQIRRFHSLRLIGRLKAGTALPHAQSQMDVWHASSRRRTRRTRRGVCAWCRWASGSWAE